MTVFYWFLLSVACISTPVPDLRVPTGTLVLRESFQGPGSERTGNWWGRFDVQGCWWEAHNTWLVVTDQELIRSSEHTLHWNASEPDEPWFCLNRHQLSRLKEVVEDLEPATGLEAYRRPVDRWTIVRSDGVHSWVGARSARPGDWEPLTEYFQLLASVHVWGQSPE